MPYLTNETLWALRERPDHLLIIGGGPIGMEMAQAHRSAGSRVTVIEGATALNREDPELAEVVLSRVRDEGVEIVEGARSRPFPAKAGAIVVETGRPRDRSRGRTCWWRSGGVPSLERLDLDTAGSRPPARRHRGRAPAQPRTGAIYAVGDVAGQGQFTHLAGYHAGIIIRSCVLGLPARPAPIISPASPSPRPSWPMSA